MSRSAYVLTMALLSVMLLLVSACRVETREEAARIQQASKANTSSNNPAYPADNPLLPIKTTRLTLAGKANTTVLTDARGFVLYYYVPDKLTKPACTGACLDAWPPLLTNSGQENLCQASLPGKFLLQKTRNGYQVAYNGHLLYTFISDRRPGQVTGNGIYDWYAVTPELK